jgi:hypothetical protein
MSDEFKVLVVVKYYAVLVLLATSYCRGAKMIDLIGRGSRNQSLIVRYWSRESEGVSR